MAEYETTQFFSNSGSRNEVRMRVIMTLSEEIAGRGKDDDASRYTYYVEELADGNRIFLRRPANLHNGFDFLVCVENYNFSEPTKKRRNYPKHDDIINDLLVKKLEQPEIYFRLFQQMTNVFQCNEIDDISARALNFNTGFSSEMILKTLKWMFIEQDIRYWNYSGRDMLWSGIPRT